MKTWSNLCPRLMKTRSRGLEKLQSVGKPLLWPNLKGHWAEILGYEPYTYSHYKLIRNSKLRILTIFITDLEGGLGLQNNSASIRISHHLPISLDQSEGGSSYQTSCNQTLKKLGVIMTAFWRYFDFVYSIGFTLNVSIKYDINRSPVSQLSSLLVFCDVILWPEFWYSILN